MRARCSTPSRIGGARAATSAASRRSSVRLGSLDPNDFDARFAGARARVALDDVPGAIADLKALAAYMQEKERPEEARQALEEAAALDPQDAELAPPSLGADPEPLLPASKLSPRPGA